MALLRLILVISGICVGCAAPAPRVLPLERRPADTLRILIGDARESERVEAALISLPRWEANSLLPVDDRGCRTLRLSQLPSDWSGRLTERWTADLGRSRTPHTWLLEPLAGAGERRAHATELVRGLEPAAGSLTTCFDRPAPDWAARLGHPELWHSDPNAGSGLGGWNRNGEGRFERRTESDARRRRQINTVLLLSPVTAPDPTEEASFDLAVLQAEGAAQRATRRGFVSERLPGWDRTYALWLDPEARWTNDPMFRRWLANAVEREATASFVFGEGAAGARGLTREGSIPQPPQLRPFSSSSAPRIELAHPANDQQSRRLAARIKAVLEQRGVEVRLADIGTTRRPAATLMIHRMQVDDPLLALLDTLWPLGMAAVTELGRLERATRIPDVGRREDRATQLEAEWQADGRLVPLVRLHAWSIRRRDLVGVEFGPAGVLWLEQAAWRR